MAEVQVVIAEDMADKEIQFPVSKSPEDDYVRISGSSLKKAGTLEVFRKFVVLRSVGPVYMIPALIQNLMKLKMIFRYGKKSFNEKKQPKLGYFQYW